MIYVSTSCVKAERINDAVKKLVDSGFYNIELSGGTERYRGFEKDLIQLKEEYNINYLLHNYFPPPKKHFVLNLASLNDKIYNDTIEHYKQAIRLSELLGADKFGLHAGFLIDPKVDELGRSIKKQQGYDREMAIHKFCSGYNTIANLSDSVDVYVENNVFSSQNKINFGFNPFLFTSYVSYKELADHINFPVLLDLAHLKVSCNTIGLSLENEVKKLLPISDYIHVSDNDGIEDSNQKINEKSNFTDTLCDIDYNGKIVTLEIYEGLKEIRSSYNLINSIIKNF
jgi:sugar phosphate isomerase/epimerase